MALCRSPWGRLDFRRSPSRPRASCTADHPRRLTDKTGKEKTHEKIYRRIPARGDWFLRARRPARPRSGHQRPAAKIKTLEAQNEGVDEALTFFETEIAGVEDQNIVIMPGYAWPVPRKVFEAYIQARLSMKSLTPEAAEKLTRTSIDLGAKWLPAAKKGLKELQDARAKDKDELSYLYNERARLKESPPAVALAPPPPAARPSAPPPVPAAPPAGPSDNWAGTWGDGATKAVLTSDNGRPSGTAHWAGSAGQSSDARIMGAVRNGPHGWTCIVTTTYEDNDKSSIFSQSYDLTIDGDAVTVKSTNDDDAVVTQWKPGVTHYDLLPWCKKGAESTGVWKRMP